jgi:hypothetical protein
VIADGEIAAPCFDCRWRQRATSMRSRNKCPHPGRADPHFKSTLPGGFSPAIGKEKARVNSGYPCLIGNPPPKNQVGRLPALLLFAPLR